MKPKDPNANIPEIKKKSFLKRAVNLVLWLFCLLLLLLVLAYFLIQMPKVQNWIVDKSTSFLSEKLETRVDIDYMELDFTDGLILKNVYLEGLEKDTLLYSEYLSTSLAKSMYSLFSKELDISEINLKNAQINLKRKADQEQNNLAILLSRLSSNESKKEENGGSFDLKVKDINLEDVSISYLDELKNQDFQVKLEKGIINIVGLGKNNTPYVFEKIYLDHPFIKVIKSGEELSVAKDSVSIVKKEVGKIFQGVSIQNLEIIEGQFKYSNLDKLDVQKTDAFDYQNVDIKNLNLVVNDAHVKSIQDVKLELESFSFIDKNRFRVDQLSSSQVNITNEIIEFEDFYFKTPRTKISDYFAMRFKSQDDFKNFTKKVRFDINMKGSYMQLADLNYFIPGLENNDFFIKNKNRQINITGKINDRINNLSGQNVEIAIDDGTYFSGSFDTRNLTEGKEALLIIKVEELNTTVTKLKQLIPKFEPPSNFYKLGNLQFRGRFDGYVENFVAYGKLNTQLGSAELDLNLDIQDGSEKAEYSGELALIDFDLGKWSDNKDFGIVNFESYIDEGRGLTQETAFAKLDASVLSFRFKDYLYQDFELDGKLDQNQFVGAFNILDPNVNLSFDGEVLIRDGIPKFDFEADIVNLDLQALKFTKNKAILQGKFNVNANGKDIYTMDGKGLLKEITFTNQDTSYQLDNVLLASFLKDEKRVVEIESELGLIYLEGDMNFAEMAESSKRVLKESYPFHFKNLKVNNDKSNATQDFEFLVHLKESKNFLDLAGLKGYKFEEFALKGYLDNRNREIQIDGKADKFIIKSDTIYNAEIASFNLSKLGKLSMSLDSMDISGRMYSPLQITTYLNQDDIDFNIVMNEVFDSLQTIDIAGSVVPRDLGYEITLDDSNLEMLGTSWSFKEGNSIIIGDSLIDIEGFYLSDGNRTIDLKDIDNRGVSLGLRQFDFLTINGLINYDKIDFSGKGDIELSVENIFGQKNIEGSVLIPDFRLNEESYGSVDLAFVKKVDQPYFLNLDLGNDSISLKVGLEVDNKSKAIKGSINAGSVPFDLFKKIIPNGISEVEGYMMANGDFYGTLEDPKMKGELRVMDGSIKIDYIGEKYFTHNQPVKITESLILFENSIITDSQNNPAFINGNMTHEFISNFYMDIKLSGDDVIILNTTEDDNPYYYGLGRGEADVFFTGPFSKADMVINAITGPSTKLSIPIKYYETGYEESFITFVSKDDLLKERETENLDRFKIEGLDVEMNISITPDAQMEIIFNEQLNDVLRGRGSGDVQIYITREGEFLTYGGFNITEGKYLLTAYQVVAKAFEVEPGGSIRWTGDPINTNLDIRAKYAGLKTNLNVFLSEFLDPNLSSDVTRLEAGRQKSVDLIMDIDGTLYEPIVNFDIAFPDLESAELKSYVDSKMRSLRANPNTLNDQVAGLITFNTFLPSTNSERLNIYTGSTALQTATTTISEFVSNQVSFLLTSMINEAIGDNSIFSSIDVELGLNQNNDIYSQDAGVLDLFDPDEIELYLNNRFKFADERFSVRFGGNYIRRWNSIESIGFNDPAFVGDVAIEYDITKDRQLKLRFYNRFDRDELSGNPKNKTGLGLSYRKEFGSMLDFQNDLKQKVKESQE